MQSKSKGSFSLTPETVESLTDCDEEEVRHGLDVVNNFLFVRSEIESDEKQIQHHVHTIYHLCAHCEIK